MRSANILHQNIINNLPSRQACKQMYLFIDTIKRFLDDDHGAPVNNKETLQKLLRRYRVRSSFGILEVIFSCLGYACGSDESSDDH